MFNHATGVWTRSFIVHFDNDTAEAEMNRLVGVLGKQWILSSTYLIRVAAC